MSQIAFPTPEPGILARRDSILAGLAALLPAGSLITEEDERRPFETDALTAYRRLPLAVALPTSTDEVARVLKYCRDAGVYVVPRGAGTSLSGGAIPQEDAIVVGLSKMSRILEVNLPDRYARVQAGVTNLAISEAVAADGFFYAPDPSSQLACTIGGNIGMNSGGAHCLKYGVTTNNILGVKLVTLDGDIIELGGSHLDAGGLDLLGLTIGSEGQLGIVTEATVRLLRAAEGARPVLFGFDSADAAGQCVAAIIGAGVVPVAMEYMDKLAIEICEGFAHAGYPLDVEAMLIIEVEGSEPEMEAQLGKITAIARTHGVKSHPRIDVGDGERADLEGPQIGIWRNRPDRRLYLHGRHGADRSIARSVAAHGRNRRLLRPARRQCVSRRRWQHASAGPLQRQ